MSAASALISLRVERSAYSPVAERATGLVFFVADALALLAAYTITVEMRGALSGEALWPIYLRLMPFLTVVPLLIRVMDLYPGVLLNPVEEFRRLTIAIAVGLSLVVVGTFLVKSANAYSRLIFTAMIPLAVGLNLSARWLVRKVLPKTGWWGIPTVLVGPPEETKVLRRMIAARPGTGIRVVAVVHAGRGRLPLGTREHVTQGAIPYALVILPTGADPKWLRDVERLVWGCKKIIVIPQAMGLLWSGMHIRECCGAVGLAVRRQLLRLPSRLAKRITDFTAALGVAALILPWIALICALIKINSRGPAFYSQERIGVGGRTFRAWKFRTMVENADAVLEQYLEADSALRAEWDASHKLKADPRVTKLGRFLRQTSLDELPQIWNVIRGEMSLVGPRPIVQEEAVKYGEEIDLYEKVRPGITGLWQVSGRSDTTYEGRVAMDVHYVRNWSVWLDVYLLARTIGVVLRKQGAY
jgi:Undecaprenyl-phosphate galactose phosphotransferase WbaP